MDFGNITNAVNNGNDSDGGRSIIEQEHDWAKVVFSGMPVSFWGSMSLPTKGNRIIIMEQLQGMWNLGPTRDLLD